MPSMILLPPFNLLPDDLDVYLTVSSAPLAWVFKRGNGWVDLTVNITFKDGDTRQIDFTIGKYPTYPGYALDLRFKGDLILELGLVDDKAPVVGRVHAFLPTVGKRI